MSLSICRSRAQQGVSAPLVRVEAHLSNGLPGLAIVGLPQTAVKESKDRVRSALLNSGFEFPAKRIVINLAPADLPKSGGRFDLAIAISLLAASKQVNTEVLEDYEFSAELALTGELRPIDGILPIALAAKQAKKILILAKENADEAGLIRDLIIIPCSHLQELVLYLSKQKNIAAHTLKLSAQHFTYPDFAEVQGQAHAKRALEIAAAGRHSVLLCGSPGTGKTMLATRLAGIMPDMSDEAAQESAAIYSISHLKFDLLTFKKRPFRAPHHTASAVALVGGGSPPRPGEISLAHQGILFLDELPEYQRGVLESLREPLESGHIIISRAAKQAEFPASFQLIAAMNPCPCGYEGDAQHACRCAPDQIQRYRAKISGPFLDRIDIRLQVPRLQTLQWMQTKTSESSSDIKQRVCCAQAKQYARAGCLNAVLSAAQLKEFCVLCAEDQLFLLHALDKLHASGRAYHRVLRVARTIADLAHHDSIERVDMLEALQLTTTFPV